MLKESSLKTTDRSLKNVFISLEKLMGNDMVFLKIGGLQTVTNIYSRFSVTQAATVREMN